MHLKIKLLEIFFLTYDFDRLWKLKFCWQANPEICVKSKIILVEIELM